MANDQPAGSLCCQCSGCSCSQCPDRYQCYLQGGVPAGTARNGCKQPACNKVGNLASLHHVEHRILGAATQQQLPSARQAAQWSLWKQHHTGSNTGWKSTQRHVCTSSHHLTWPCQCTWPLSHMAMPMRMAVYFPARTAGDRGLFPATYCGTLYEAKSTCLYPWDVKQWAMHRAPRTRRCNNARGGPALRAWPPLWPAASA